MRATTPAPWALALLLAACLPSRPPPEPQLVTPKLERRCGLTAAPVTREQALCIARAAGAGAVDGTYVVEAGQDLEREPVWILREACEQVPRCVELWIRQADGAIVNKRWLYAFEGY